MGRIKLRFTNYSAAALAPYSYPVAWMPWSQSLEGGINEHVP